MAKEMNKFLEASLENAEALVDNLTRNEWVKSIPVVGTALKIIAGSMDLRDHIFTTKIERFIVAIEEVKASQRLKFLESVEGDTEAMTSAGETALLVLDKLSSLKKAELLGFYFSTFLGGELDQYQFRRIANAIDIAFIDDIEQFLKHGMDDLLSQKWFMEGLYSSGMTTISSGQTVEDVGELYYEPSSMGRHMFDLWEVYKTD